MQLVIVSKPSSALADEGASNDPEDVWDYKVVRYLFHDKAWNLRCWPRFREVTEEIVISEHGFIHTVEPVLSTGSEMCDSTAHGFCHSPGRNNKVVRPCMPHRRLNMVDNMQQLLKNIY